MKYFQNLWPSIRIVPFTSCPGYNLRGGEINKGKAKGGLQHRRRRAKPKMAAEGALRLFEACDAIVGGAVDLATWRQKIIEELSAKESNASAEGDDGDDGIEIGETIQVNKIDTGFEAHSRYRDGVLTIGCVGQPNVGKSSLINAVMGRKVVSVSKTPGHTKHFQTIFLTQNVRLCDCPGLVFPSKVAQPLQVLSGSYPIAQLREPFSIVKFLAERLNLPAILKLAPVDKDSSEWSAYDICEQWAEKRGFRTARAARLDANRAANGLLRMALDGKLNLCLYPPNYVAEKEKWLRHPDVPSIVAIQAMGDSNEPEECLDRRRDSASESDEDADSAACGDDAFVPSGSRFDLLMSK